MFRSLILLLSFVVVSQASFAQKKEEKKLVSGPMLGYCEYREALIWLEVTKEADEVEINYRQQGTTAWKEVEYKGELHKLFNPIKIEIPQLEPGITYEYEIEIDDKKQAFAYPLTFKTRELWEYRKDPPSFSFLFGSCAYINDSVYDRPGAPYGQSYKIFESMAAQPTDFMLWGGDNMYLREVDWSTEYGIWYRNSHTRRIPEMQKLFATRPNFATWDDHDYGPNDADGSYDMKGYTLQAFKEYWGNRNFGTPEVPGVFSRFTWSDAEFFMLDDRYYRGAEALANDDPEKTFLGKEQMLWLKTALLSSRSKFKFIVCGNQIINAANTGECMRNYTREYNELMDFITGNKIPGIVMLTGDRHFTEVTQIKPAGFYTIYDITGSPFTSKAYSALDKSSEFVNPMRVDSTLLTVENYLKLSISGPKKERKLLVEAFDINNVKKWELTVTEAQLAIPK